MAITPVALPAEVFQVNKKIKKFQNEKDAIILSPQQELRDKLAAVVSDHCLESELTMIRNHKLDNGLILPVFVPEKKVAFDVLSLDDFAEDKVGNKHCKSRMDQAQEAGLRFIQIFEDEWEAKNEIVRHRLANILGTSNRIYARNTQVKEIPWGFAKTLLNATHIQGSGAGAGSVLGLVDHRGLVATMTLGISRFEKTGPKDFELIRFSSVDTVVGGFSKLLKYFVGSVQPDRIISYSDARWSIGNVYSSNGFDLTGHSTPGYYWTRDGVRHNRIKFQKHKLGEVLEKFNPMMTEKQNCEANEYKRIYDAGMQKWEMTFE